MITDPFWNQIQPMRLTHITNLAIHYADARPAAIVAWAGKFRQEAISHSRSNFLALTLRLITIRMTVSNNSLSFSHNFAIRRNQDEK